MIRFTAVSIVAILGMVIYWLSDADRLETVSTVVESLFSDSTIEPERFRRTALIEINSLRGQLQSPPLTLDEKVQEALDRFVSSHEDVSELNLDQLFAFLRTEFPGMQFLSATLLFDPRESGLIESFRMWADATRSDYRSLAATVFQDGFHQGCLAVLTTRLPVFDLGMANRVGGRYFNECPRCGETHAVELHNRSRTLILSCPDCHRPYDVLAADVAGVFRHATQFFEGFRPPEAIRTRTTDPELKVREIWGAVLRHCEYEYDTKTLKRGEAWKTPSQTWKDRAGDCEDTAILLADLLISSEIEARVAVGWNIHIGQHAWCVARSGERQFILESTMRTDGLSLPELLPVADAAGEYQPEQLFDRDYLYFRESGMSKPLPCNDYWTKSDWAPVSRVQGAE